MTEFDKCLECGRCGQCQLLKELGVSPKQLAGFGIGATEAFSCALCGVCEAACPARLSPRSLFAEGRRQAVASGEMNLDAYEYLLPDRAHNLMQVYREHYKIDYSDAEPTERAEVCFFPGCTLMTYAPELTRAVFAELQASCHCDALAVECCGKPLSLMGLPQRSAKAADRLLSKLNSWKSKELIVACPGCYYELKNALSGSDIKLTTVYEALGCGGVFPEDERTFTVHDSCPDRFEGRFAQQVRERLSNQGLTLSEMAHNRQKSLCCGSGGMISKFRPDLTEQMVIHRISEARQAGADVMVGYCLSCVAKFADAKGAPLARHALSLILGRDDDFAGVRNRVVQMLEGPQGARLWDRMNEGVSLGEK